VELAISSPGQDVVNMLKKHFMEYQRIKFAAVLSQMKALKGDFSPNFSVAIKILG
jgi:hypothetical protein